MSIIVTANKTQYQLLNHSAHNFASTQATALKPFQFEKLVPQLSPKKPESWKGVVENLFPAESKQLNDESIIKTKILEGLGNGKIRMVPFSSSQSGSSSGTGGASASGSNASNYQSRPLTSAEKGQTNPPQQNSAAATQDELSNQSPAPVNNGTEQGVQTADNTCTNGCPISMISGEELLQIDDAVLPGPVPFKWTRTYRSSFNDNIGLGYGWTHSASERLFFSETAIEYYDSEARCILFKCPEVGQTSRYLPEGLSLERPSDFSFILKQKGEHDKVFTAVSGKSPFYRLTQIRHAHYQPAKSHKEPAKGFAIALHYNSGGQLSWLEGSWGKSFLISRDDNGRIIKVELSDQASEKRKTVAEYEYNEENDLIAHKNANGVGENYSYQNHLFKQRTLVTGFSYYYEWDNDDHTARCIRNWGDDGIYDYKFEWDPENNASSATDSRGYKTQYKYNDFGQIVEEIDNEGHLHQYTYENGRKIKYVDPQGNKTEYLFDNQANPIGYRDALGQSEVYSYFKDNLTGFQNKAKARWRYEYNEKDQLVNAINPFGESTKYTYTSTGLVSSILSPGNKKQQFRWSAKGELLSVTDPLGHQKVLEHNEWGQLVSSELKLKGNISAGKTQFEYTPTGKLALVKTPDGKSTEYFYNDNDQLIKHVDPNGRITQFEYDGLSQVSRRINPEGHTLSYEYDKERNLTALVNENGERYQFFYDGNERLVKEVGFDGRVQEYAYNPAGHLIKHTDSGQIETKFERDPLGRMVTKTSRSLFNSALGSSELSDTQLQVEKSRFAYDRLDRLVETYNDDHYLSFEYNLLGNLVEEHHSRINDKNERVKSSFKTIKYQNTWPGIRTHMQLPDQQLIEYDYTAHHQLSSVAINGTPITQIERDAIGREVSRHQGELTTYSEYDPMGRLQKQRTLHQQNKEQSIHREFSYDQFGNLSQVKDGNVETKYVYDLLSRLTKSEQLHDGELHREDFHFDPAGNLLGDKKSNNVRQAAGNRLKMQGDRKFSYDERGNLIKEKRGKEGKLETNFVYNLQNQLIKVEKQGQVTQYNYDSLGRRREKIDEFGVTTYLWSGDQMVQEERNNIKKTYVFEPESFKPLVMVQDEEIYHYHLDHLGTPQELSDSQGKIVWKARYKTYGNAAYKEVEEVENNLRFQGQYFDEETGLHYNRHRYYNPSVGQFISQDPIGLLGGVNNYQYAPNPTGWVDPFGLKCNEWNAFQKRTKGHFSNSTEAAKSYQRMKEVEAMAKPNRPLPETYLPQSYIDAHISKFNSEGSSFIAVESWMRNPKYQDLPARKFVGLRSEMDKIIDRYESMGNDWTILRDELALGDVDLSGESILYVRISPSDPRFSYSMPDGNEAGAYPNEWVPGGKTKGGATEAALVGSEKVSHKNSLDELSKNFNDTKRLQ